MGDKIPQDLKGKGAIVCDDHEVDQERIQQIPIGFKFEPTNDQLVFYYLKNKIQDRHYQTPCIPETNIYDHLPEELLEGNEEKNAFFFTRIKRRHEKGPRADRTVKNKYGHWRMSGSEGSTDGDKVRKTGYKINNLKFYIGTNKKDGKATEWLMKEYVMCPHQKEKLVRCSSSSGSSSKTSDDWVICQIHIRQNAKRTESSSDCGGHAGNDTTNTCNKRQKIEKERKSGKRQAAGIEIENRQNVMMPSSDVPPSIHHHNYADHSYNQFGGATNNLAQSSNPILYNSQFGGASNNLAQSSNPILIGHNYENHYHFGGYSGMIQQEYQQQPHQQFEQPQHQYHDFSNGYVYNANYSDTRDDINYKNGGDDTKSQQHE